MCRAKMLQYFTTTNDETKNIQIEQLFWNSWRIPMPGNRQRVMHTFNNKGTFTWAVCSNKVNPNPPDGGA